MARVKFRVRWYLPLALCLLLLPFIIERTVGYYTDGQKLRSPAQEVEESLRSVLWEDPRLVERYGTGDRTFRADGAPKMTENLLIARRLVEAGARCVSLNFSRWDWHGGDGMNFPRSRQEMPLLDQGLSALLTDLKERGLNKDVAVVMWGEFGRTPKINKNNSRDHWPRANFAFMAGGGMNHGQIIGSTDKHGNEPSERPVKFQEVFATLYTCLGINTETATVTDSQGRPHYLIDSGIKPIRELVG